jgi:hypothetical protein
MQPEAISSAGHRPTGASHVILNYCVTSKCIFRCTWLSRFQYDHSSIAEGYLGFHAVESVESQRTLRRYMSPISS